MAKLQESLKNIEEHKNSSPHYRELLDIYGEILILREEFSRKMDRHIFDIDAALIGKKLSGGLPLIDLTRADIDLSHPEAYFGALMKIAGKINLEEAQAVMRDLREGKLVFSAMIKDSFENFSSEEPVPESEEDSFDLVGFFMEESLRPALERVAQKYAAAIRDSNWTEGYCPVCGKEPKIGELREEEGRRFLFCSQCGSEWTFVRIKCPFCGNEEQKTLSYFTVEEDERYRVDVCDRCKRYIKTVDFRSTRETPDLDIEDIATIHLDMLANEEGYN